MTTLYAPTIDPMTADMLFPTDEHGDPIAVPKSTDAWIHAVVLKQTGRSLTHLPVHYDVLDIDAEFAKEVDVNGDTCEPCARAQVGDYEVIVRYWI